MAPKETENNAYAKFWGDKRRALWYVMVFLELSICVEDSGLLFDSVIILLFSQPIVWDVGMPRIPLGHAENFRKCIDVKLR